MRSYFYEPESGEVWDPLVDSWVIAEVAAAPDCFLRRDVEFDADGGPTVRDASGHVLAEAELTPREQRWLRDESDAEMKRRDREARDFAAECGGRWS